VDAVVRRLRRDNVRIFAEVFDHLIVLFGVDVCAVNALYHAPCTADAPGPWFVAVDGAQTPADVVLVLG
jgi:hypothetical protein